MLQPACTLCGSPLPAVPTDPAHPDWCPSCAARAIGAPGPTSAVPPQAGTWATTVDVRPGDLEVRARLHEGLLVGLAAAAIGGGIWWGVAASTQKAFPYLAVLVGIITGQGVLIGARRGGPLQAALAGVLTLVSMGVAQYFVLRSIAVSDPRSGTVPLWQGFDVARRAVQEQLTHSAITAACVGIAAVVALVSAAGANRRPIV